MATETSVTGTILERVLAGCSGKEPMNVRREREAEGPQRDRSGRMQRRRTRGTAQSIVLVPNVRYGHGGAGQPRCQPPQAHMTGVSRFGERSENDANGHIRHGNQNHRTGDSPELQALAHTPNCRRWWSRCLCSKTPQLRPEIRPKTRLGGHAAAGPRSPKRRIKSRNRVTSACHVVGRVARNSGGLRPLPLGHGTTWISSQLRGACASGPAGGAVSSSSSPRPWRRAQLTWQIISGAVKRPRGGFRSGAKRAMRSRTAARAWGSKREGIARPSEEGGSSLTDRA